ncbi:MAG: hypothetical protein VB115_15150 [Christensenellaceae bacterium]|nr:hypothetical protein [Christensenellaceae bacterium]
MNHCGKITEWLEKAAECTSKVAAGDIDALMELPDIAELETALQHAQDDASQISRADLKAMFGKVNALAEQTTKPLRVLTISFDALLQAFKKAGGAHG